MSDVLGLPLHPLVVHAAVVLVPLVTLGMVLAAALITSSCADAAVLDERPPQPVGNQVIAAGEAIVPVVHKALESITNGRILGLVLNDVRFTVVDRLYYRYDDYGKSYYNE